MAKLPKRHGFIAFIDESGVEGGKDNPLSSDFFVLSAVVCRTAKGKNPISDALDAAGKAGDLSHKRLQKFSKAKNRNQKLLYCKYLAQAETRHAVVICHKESFEKDRMLSENGSLYYFASQLILERISWICRDAHKRAPSGNGRAAIVFSERNTLDYKRFREYAEKIKSGQGKYESFAAWDHLDLRAIVARPHAKNYDGLLAADYIASSYGQALEPNPYGFTDDHYARALARNVYSPKGRQRWSNGMKVFPLEAEKLVETDPRLWWIKPCHGYKKK